jgi:zeta-carotene desaturase
MAMAATSCALVPAFVAGRRRAPPRRRAAATVVRCSLDSNVSDMGVNGEDTVICAFN